MDLTSIAGAAQQARREAAAMLAELRAAHRPARPARCTRSVSAPAAVATPGAQAYVPASFAHDICLTRSRVRGIGIPQTRMGSTQQVERPQLVEHRAHFAEDLARRLHEGWHRRTEWRNLLDATCGPPAAAA